ncbi:MAG: hypothetical protein AAGI38_24040 [Bacteroidota bacterium]
MWEIDQEELPNWVTKYKIKEGARYLSFSDWIRHTKDSDEFIEFFSSILTESGYEGYFWEVKPLTADKLADPFEFVLVASNILLTLRPNDTPFKQHFASGEEVVSFSNLGGDAQLVVPAPLQAGSDYAHLSRFMKNAPASQIIQFWRRVAVEYEKKIGDRIKWLSTAGLGVYWLHVRIDSRPKYYRFTPYKAVR